MGRLIEIVNTLACSRKARWVGGPLVLAAAAAAVISQSQTVPVTGTAPLVNLSAEPLYARGARAKPTLTLALSVEFPTVGAQYVSGPGASTDSTYSPNDEYIGYFHVDSCYNYNNIGASAAPYFVRSGAATGRGCSDAFSGNFLNWATSSAIDILRYGLTGGDRVIDDANLTVLQRAVLPNSSVSGNFWNASNFPAKILSPALAASAIPANLRGTYTGEIYVSSCLNRVHFGTQATNTGCDPANADLPGENTLLGVTSPPIAATGVNTSHVAPLPSNFAAAACANENGTCAVGGTAGQVMQVAYGADSRWIFRRVNAATNVNCSNATFTDPAPGSPKSCRVRVAPQASTARTADKFFYSRVQVCESGPSGNLLDPRTGLCLRYPSGYYKPVGNLQRSADDVRVAAFGYLNDSSLDRYGGVLRAPMKYVGPRSYGTNFALSQTANTVQEWDPSTGAFLRDPDFTVRPAAPVSGTGSNWPGQNMSGVINYLNQFGRTGVFGQYKTHDPVGELYYESLRYLQGLGPTNVGGVSTTSAIAGINDTMRDGFPVYTAWTDPHPAVTGMTDYSCIKNNIVAIGDVNTHADKYIPGNTRVSVGDQVRAVNVTNNEPNFYQWTRVVGAFEEANAAQTYVDGNGATRNVSNFNGANGNPDSPIEDNSPGGCCNDNSYYMAGVAYWANTHDIRGTGWTAGDGPSLQRPGMRVKTYILDVNEYGQQTPNDVRRRNQFYLAGKYGGFDDDAQRGRPGVGNPFIAMAADSSASGAYALVPSNSASAAYVVNENLSWERVPVPADANRQEAKSYFLSSSAADVLRALDQIFEEVRTQARSIAGGAISTQRLTTNTGYIYQAQFDPTDWSGDLLPVAIAASGTTVQVGNASTSPWRNAASAPVGAAGILDGRNIASSPRNIYVGYNASASAPSFDSAAFEWASLPTSVQTLLQYPGYPAYPASAAIEATDANAQLRLAYLRGDRSQEAPSGIFRRRGSRLGDIVNSGVVYSGAPSPAVTATAAYSTFRSTNANRTRALFVGANDGMLHAFNADTGAELFAYIPSWLVPKLPALTHPSYIHQSYQDATPTVGEVDTDPSTAETWRTVLVAGSGGGGQGVFALDVSSPANWSNSTTANNNVLWEFSERDDPAMGNVIGRPQLLKLNVGSSTSPSYRWFAVVASGVNNNAADGNASTGAPALFFLALDKSKSGQWIEGTSASSNYFKITFPQNTTTIANGMVGFSVRLGTAGEVSYIFAGDLQGNLWKLDMAGLPTYAAGGITAINAFSYFKDGSNLAIPMYTAYNSAGTVRQPITMEPSLAFAANRSIIVSFGTGKFLESTDNAGPYNVQTVYALLDNNSATPDSSSPTAAISGRGRLMQGTASAGTVSVPDFVWGRPATDASAVSRSGWYFDYFQSATTGERQVSNFAIISGKLIFGTVIPAPDTCSNGDGNLYVVDLRYGDGTTTASTVGILGEPFLVQVGASTLRPSDTTGRRREQTRYQIVLQGSAGSAAPPSLGFDDITWPGRLGWREVSNYQELRNTP